MSNLFKTDMDFNDPKFIETIRKTVASEANDQEFQMFIAMAAAAKLNPLKREIWFIKTKGYQKKDGTEVEGKAQIITGINGFYAIANSHKEFDGMESDIVEDEKGNILYAWAKVWRKDRKYPSTGKAKFSEYCKPAEVKQNGKGESYQVQGVWQKFPSAMILKVAEAQAIRKAFIQQAGGIYLQEEFDNTQQEEGVQDIKPLELEQSQPQGTFEIKVNTELFDKTKEAMKSGSAYCYKYPKNMKFDEILEFKDIIQQKGGVINEECTHVFFSEEVLDIPREWDVTQKYREKFNSKKV